MEASAETASQTLHRLTSQGPYDAENPDLIWAPPVDDPRVVADLVVNDTDRLPWFYKRYDRDLPTVPLPREFPTTTASTVAVLAGTAEIEPGTLDLPQLSRLLHLSAGVVRTMVRPYATWLFRAEARRVDGSRSSSTSRCPKVTTSPRASTGTSLKRTRSFRSGLRQRAACRPPS